MTQKISLSRYVYRRNGVKLGHKSSLFNMLVNAFGAPSFYQFWLYWNPVWGYYLGRYIMRPLSKRLPSFIALILTFAVSGLLHDVAVSLIKMNFVFIFTPWFMIMGAIAVLSKHYSNILSNSHFIVCSVINLIILCSSFYLSHCLMELIFTLSIT